MSRNPTDAEHADRIHRRLTRLRSRAVGLTVAALILGPVMWVWTGHVAWMGVSVFGALWLVLFLKATGPPLVAAKQLMGDDSLPTSPPDDSHSAGRK